MSVSIVKRILRISGLVYHLVKEKGMTLQGAKQKLKMNRETTIRTTEILDRLKLIREGIGQYA